MPIVLYGDHMVQNAVRCIMELSGIGIIGIGIGIELPSKEFRTAFGIAVEFPISELELELDCQNGIDPGSSGVDRCCV